MAEISGRINLTNKEYGRVTDQLNLAWQKLRDEVLRHTSSGRFHANEVMPTLQTMGQLEAFSQGFHVGAGEIVGRTIHITLGDEDYVFNLRSNEDIKRDQTMRQVVAHGLPEEMRDLIYLDGGSVEE